MWATNFEFRFVYTGDCFLGLVSHLWKLQHGPSKLYLGPSKFYIGPSKKLKSKNPAEFQTQDLQSSILINLFITRVPSGQLNID